MFIILSKWDLTVRRKMFRLFSSKCWDFFILSKWLTLLWINLINVHIKNNENLNLTLNDTFLGLSSHKAYRTGSHKTCLTGWWNSVCFQIFSVNINICLSMFTFWNFWSSEIWSMDLWRHQGNNFIVSKYLYLTANHIKYPFRFPISRINKNIEMFDTFRPGMNY